MLTACASGPFRRWPLGRGFKRYYGCLGGETDQSYPDLTLDNAPTVQPGMPEDGYHLSEDPPVDGSSHTRVAAVRPQTSRPRTRFVYYPNGSVVPSFAAPPV
jgi:arylsulfatase A-like enzyme